MYCLTEQEASAPLARPFASSFPRQGDKARETPLPEDVWDLFRHVTRALHHHGLLHRKGNYREPRFPGMCSFAQETMSLVVDEMLLPENAPLLSDLNWPQHSPSRKSSFRQHEYQFLLFSVYHCWSFALIKCSIPRISWLETFVTVMAIVWKAVFVESDSRSLDARVWAAWCKHDVDIYDVPKRRKNNRSDWTARFRKLEIFLLAEVFEWQLMTPLQNLYDDFTDKRKVEEVVSFRMADGKDDLTIEQVLSLLNEQDAVLFYSCCGGSAEGAHRKRKGQRAVAMTELEKAIPAKMPASLSSALRK
jgi:hypothetical protein